MNMNMGWNIHPQWLSRKLQKLVESDELRNETCYYCKTQLAIADTNIFLDLNLMNLIDISDMYLVIYS